MRFFEPFLRLRVQIIRADTQLYQRRVSRRKKQRLEKHVVLDGGNRSHFQPKHLPRILSRLNVPARRDQNNRPTCGKNSVQDLQTLTSQNPVAKSDNKTHPDALEPAVESS